jgi:hypothetical protein
MLEIKFYDVSFTVLAALSETSSKETEARCKKQTAAKTWLPLQVLIFRVDVR